jgi:hypothetical protein
VFFPFAYARDGVRLACADRITYLLPTIDKEFWDKMFIGLEDGIGYLVQIKDGTLIINSARHARGGFLGPATWVDLYPNCGFPEKERGGRSRLVGWMEEDDQKV